MSTLCGAILHNLVTDVINFNMSSRENLLESCLENILYFVLLQSGVVLHCVTSGCDRVVLLCVTSCYFEVGSYYFVFLRGWFVLLCVTPGQVVLLCVTSGLIVLLRCLIVLHCVTLRSDHVTFYYLESCCVTLCYFGFESCQVWGYGFFMKKKDHTVRGTQSGCVLCLINLIVSGSLYNS